MFKRNRNIFQKLFLNQYLTVIIILVILVMISIPLAKNVSKKYEIDSEVVALEEEIQSLQKKNQDLEKLIDEYGSADFVEEIARLNLGLKKEGEEVVVIKNDTDGNPQNEIDYSVKNIKFAGDIQESNPRKWLNYFIKK